MADSGITPREAEVLRAVQDHLTNAEIAERLYLSERTVESHVSSLLRKLGAANRRELARVPRATPATTNVPRVATTFVGRSEEIDLLKRALDRNRVVTLLGSGGIGKTRLAMEAALHTSDAFEGGDCFVALAAVEHAEHVIDAVASALNLNGQPGDDLLTTVGEALAHRPRSLLVLDNCEHVVDACTLLVEHLISVGSGAVVLATSRQVLGIAGECVITVQPLAEADAMELFVERSSVVAPAVTLGDTERIAIARICRRLDNLPLAIELAAAQMRVLDPEELEARLDERLLTLPRRAGPSAHHGSIAAAAAWSYERLSERSKRVFQRLSVFAGSCTIDAAEAVCSGSDVGIDSSDVLAAVGDLLDRSLLIRDREAEASRLRQLETLRLFGMERLAESGNVEQARRAHALHYLDVARAVEPDLVGPHESAAIAQLRGEEANLRAALDWARENDRPLAYELVVALWRYWSTASLHHAAVPYVRSLIELDHSAVDPSARAWGLTAAASLLAERGESRTALVWAEEAIETFAATADDRGLGFARLAIAWTLDSRASLDEADAMVEAVLASAERTNDRVLKGFALECRAHVASMRGDQVAARHWGERELAVWLEVASGSQLAWTYRNLAYAARSAGELDDAMAFAERSLAAFGNDEGAAAHVLNVIADVCRLQGRIDESVGIYERAIAGFSSMGDRRCLAAAYKNMGQLAAARGDHTGARHFFIESMVIRHSFRDELGIAECLDGLAGVAATLGRADRAAVLLAAGAARRSTIGAEQLPEDRAFTDDLLETVRHALTADQFDRAWADGLALDAEEALAHAHLT